MDDHKRPNCFIKFWLMLWKNIRVLLGKRCLVACLVIIFIVLPCLLMLLRRISTLKSPKRDIAGPPSISEKISAVSGLNRFFYSPENTVLEGLMQNATLSATACRNAKELFSMITKRNKTEDDEVASLGMNLRIINLGIEFPDSWSDITELPDAFTFTIRLPASKKKAAIDELIGASSDVYKPAFLSTQNSLSKAFIEYKVNQSKYNMTFTKPDFEDFPDRENLTDPNISSIFPGITLCLVVLTICMAITIVKSIVEEKELQIKETLNLVGVGNSLQWLAWYVHYFILLLIASAIYTMCWTIPLPSRKYAYLFFTNWSTFLVILIVFSHCLICFSFMMSSFMSTTMRASMNTIIILLLSYLPAILPIEGLVMTIFLSIFPVSGLSLLLGGIQDKEIFGVGVQWNNIFNITYPGEYLCIGYILLLMLLGSLISLIICLYVEQLRPGSYDIAKPWHFPCTFCCKKADHLLPYTEIFYSCFAGSRRPTDVERPDDIESKLIGPTPQGKSPGVQVRDLHKTFGEKEAVRGITFDIFKDEITVLLGHNGAGKTTLISMLAGFTKPTSGTALVNGHDIRKNPRQAQQCIGLCPQHNVLFSNLSVPSHIRLFSQLRGLRGKELKEEVAKYMSKLNYQAKKSTKAGKLSGGNQRRLSLACALCGGVKVAICDEPSTGLDPASRRAVWKLIIESKQGCTILLTTHQMDDGEVLGDRIVIISDGKLRCMGTLAFLKQQVDASILLTCETKQRCDVEMLTAFIAGYVKGIGPFRKIGRDVCYKIPQSKRESFPALFRDLEKNQKQLRIRGFGLSPESLEEIFMNYGAENFDARMAGGTEMNHGDDDTYTSVSEDGSRWKYDNDYEWESEDESENKPSCCAHWRAMSLKKILALYDNKVYFIILLLLPIIVYLANLISSKNDNNKSELSMNVNAYEGLGLSILVSEPKASTEEVQSAYDAVNRLVGSDIELKRISEPVDVYVQDAYSTPEGQRDMLFVICALSLNDSLIGWVGARELIHAPPMIINLVYNVAAQRLFGAEVSIDVINHPYDDTSTVNFNVADNMIIFFLAVLLTLLAAPIISERTSHMKMQQEVSGLGMFTYWLSHLVYDMLVFLVFALLSLLLTYEAGPWHHILFVLLLMGLSGLCLVYLLTCLCRATVLAIFLILILSIFIGIILILISILNLAPDFNIMIQSLFYFHPLIAGMFALKKNFAYFRTCSENNDRLDLIELREATCIDSFAYTSKKCVCQHPIMYEESAFLIGTAVLYWALLMFYEYCGFIWYVVKGCCTKKGDASIQDPKVYKEAERIEYMDKNKIRRRALVVKSIRKHYCCGTVAVNNISFAIKPGVCLGLLGHNGAGKTTTFKMIVGEESIDKGEIWIRGYSIKTKRRKAIKELGYCPQFDSFFEYFTGRQMLKFFLQLRGVDKSEIQERIEKLGVKFAFSQHLDRKIKFYSGGTKRKVNAAVGCMGKSLICLDEPSSGVDPASRRHVWNILGRQADKGKAMLLTSHSMDEINALCSKVVMLVDGNIHSMGSNQHVKNKSSKGLELKLVLKAKPEHMAGILSKIEAEIQAAYPNAILQDKFEFSGRMNFLIPLEDASWADIFAFVDRKRGSWQLEDYTLQQPSLENVFIEIEESKKKKNATGDT